MLAALQNGRCIICGRRMRGAGDPHGDITLHHFVPIYRNGPKQFFTNLTAAHSACNNAWGDRPPAVRHWWRYFLREVRRGGVEFGVLNGLVARLLVRPTARRINASLPATYSHPAIVTTRRIARGDGRSKR